MKYKIFDLLMLLLGALGLTGMVIDMTHWAMVEQKSFRHRDSVYEVREVLRKQYVDVDKEKSS